MPETKSNAVERPASDASFDPYGRLLRMLMPSLRGVVVHDGFSNLVWASDEWDFAEHPDLIKDAIANALTDTSEFSGIARTLDADRAVYSLRRTRRAHRIARRRQPDRAPVRHANRAAPAADRAPVGAAGAGVPDGASSRCAPNWVPANAISTCASATWI